MTAAFALRVWRSKDAGVSWEKIVDVPATRDAGPLSVGTAADGTPFVAGNPVQADRSYFREALWLWPLNAARSGIETPVVVRDGPAAFGGLSPRLPSGKWERPWRVDHPTSAVLRLVDGKWHCVLVHRVNRNDALLPKGHPARVPKQVEAFIGCYIEEVMSRGPVRPVWHFTE